MQAYLLTLDHTYDHVLQARSRQLMMSQLAASASITLTKEDVQAWRQQREDAEVPWDEHDMKGLLLRWKVGNLYRQLCGQRSARHDWIDILITTF